jgi:hypothetical protein
VAISVSSPVTGGPQTGFTSPTYTLVTDQPPNASTGKQWYVSALGGTQTGVRAHSISDPFTITYERPGVLKTLAGLISGITGLYGKVPDNVFTSRVRKGVLIAANNLPRVAEAYRRISIPAGADSYDAPNVRALFSLSSGADWATAAGIGDTLVSGSL